MKPPVLRNSRAMLAVMILAACLLCCCSPARAASEWNYSSDAYNYDLAVETSYYTTVAGDPAALSQELINNGYSGVETFNYESGDEATVALAVGSKAVICQGTPHTLIVVVCRGTDGLAEWQGNMDITGSFYKADQPVHANFAQAAQNVREILVDYMNRYAVSDPLLLISGHSRGGAVANLLADNLSARSEAPFQNCEVYAYTFAAPNVTAGAIAPRPNIFNFCFADDVIVQIPLKAWGYNKPGRICYAIAENLYASNAGFQAELGPAEFNYQVARDFLDYLDNNWPGTWQYYNRVMYPQSGGQYRQDETLYYFFRNRVAPAESGIAGAGDDMLIKGLNSPVYWPAASFFLQGAILHTSIWDTHKPMTYYLAVRDGLFVVPDEAVSR